MGTPLVHVLVINWNGKEHLEACFDSLISQTYSNLRIVLVDNASTDGSVEFIKARYSGDPRVEILSCGSNLGWSRGNNLGIARALETGADYIFLLNNDTATEPDAVERLVEFAEAHEKAGANAPKMLLFDQPFLINSIGISCSIVGSAWDEGLGRVDSPRWQEPKQVLGVCGGAMFLRADALRNAGVLPDDFEIYLDDLDLCLRIWDAGYECWSCPSATVRHKFSATMGEGERARRKYYLNTRNRLRLILRNFPANQLAKSLGLYALNEIRAIGRATLNGEAWKILSHIQSWFAAVAYIAKAIEHRRARRQKQKQIGSFWPLVRTDMTFFPGIELPQDGWYAPRAWNSFIVRPISRNAWLNVPSGTLSVSHANCYPQYGETDTELRSNGQKVGNIATRERSASFSVTVAAGTLELVCNKIFYAEETGESIDIGGWIECKPPFDGEPLPMIVEHVATKA